MDVGVRIGDGAFVGGVVVARGVTVETCAIAG
jgi:hypothetical protein